MPRTVARQKIAWCNQSIDWAAVAVDDIAGPGPRNAVWSYRLDGLTFFGFPFDPGESGTTTRERAVNWLNRHHVIVRREHFVTDRDLS